MSNTYLNKHTKLDIYSDFLISHSGYSTATMLSNVFNKEISHDQITRLLNDHIFIGDNLFKSIKKTLREVENNEGVLSIDDTISEKPYTDVNKINNYYYSHAKGVIVKGINILSSIVTYSNNKECINIPINYKIIEKDIEELDSKGNTIYKSSINKNELFRDLIGNSIVNRINYRYILADSWFCNKENIKFILKCKKKFILGIPSNRNIALTEEDNKNKRYIKLNSIFNSSNEEIIYIEGISTSFKVYKKELNDNGEVIYLITNDLSILGDDIYNTYMKRWNIEEYHKSLKQNTSLSKSPTKRVISQSNHIYASIVGFFKLERLKIKSKLNHFALRSKMLLISNRYMYEELIKLRERYDVV